MSDIFKPLFGFIVGEALLIVIVLWTYFQLTSAGVIQPTVQNRRLTTLLLVTLPMLLAGLALPGVINRMNTVIALLPPTGGEIFLTPVSQPTESASISLEASSTSTSFPTTTAASTDPVLAPSATLTSQPALLATPTPASSSPTPPAFPATASQTPATAITTSIPPTLPASETLGVPSLTPQPTIAATQTPPLTPSQTIPAEDGLPEGEIVYLCQVFQDTSRDQICLVPADGSQHRRLTSNDNADYNYPSLSGDGRSMVYTSNETSSFEIFEMDLATGSARQLSNGWGSALAPEVSPEGLRVVFTLRKDGHNAIWVMSRDGSHPRQLYGPPDGEGWDPTWSPDGSLILFASNMDGSIQLYTIRPDGSDLKQLTTLDGLSGRTDWSPDGSGFVTYAGPAWNHEIFLLDQNGKNPQQITHGGNNLAPSFSPDGRWIAFTSYQENPEDENGCEIYIMKRDGSNLQRLTRNEYCDWQPRWGP